MSLLHAHLIFVTKYCRRVFTAQMLTFCEHTLRAVCAELAVELVEFNGEADHVHLLVALSANLADLRSGASTQRTHRLRRASRIHRCVCPRPYARTPVVPVLLRSLLRRRTAVDHQAIHRRPSAPTLSAGLRPAKDGMG